MVQVALIIPVRNGEAGLKRLFESLIIQTSRCDVFVVDSSSTDKSREIASINGAKVTVISPFEFNHGGTRQKIVNTNPGYDIYVFMTQDAYLSDAKSLEHLIAPFSNAEVGAVCGRQLPHTDANPLAEHARLFNYPTKSIVKTINDSQTLGIKTPFMSNSYAAYRREALFGVGGFPTDVILSEDMYVASRMLLKGWKIVYTCEACCHHSHNYTFLQEFRRYFDQGVFHSREGWIRGNFGGADGEGLRYVKSELSYLGFKKLYLWPTSLFRNAIKLFGYRLGLIEAMLPVWLKCRLSMHRRFWVMGKR